VRPFGSQRLTIAKKPATGGLLQFSRWSPDSQFDGARPEIPESLQPFFEIFPFSGDGDRRPGLIYIARLSLQCNSPNSPLRPYRQMPANDPERTSNVELCDATAGTLPSFAPRCLSELSQTFRFIHIAFGSVKFSIAAVPC
jgi:hypothetical protein